MSSIGSFIRARCHAVVAASERVSLSVLPEKPSRLRIRYLRVLFDQVALVVDEEGATLSREHRGDEVLASHIGRKSRGAGKTAWQRGAGATASSR
jgi:hypothetical protein